jgi:hypothetical protein
MVYRVLDRRAKKGFLLRWTFVLCTVSFALLVQSNTSHAKVQDVNGDEFAEFDLDEEEFEVVKKKEEDKWTKDQKTEKEKDDGLDLDASDGDGPEVDDSDFDEDDEDEAVVEVDQGDEEEDEDEEEATVEDDEEFEHFEDDEEFENFESDPVSSTTKEKKKPTSRSRDDGGLPKTIKITNVPARFTNSWENYYLEILMAAGIVVYFINFFTGKSKNARVAGAWFEQHRALLESNFALVGDDGAKDVDDIESRHPLPPHRDRALPRRRHLRHPDQHDEA